MERILRSDPLTFKTVADPYTDPYISARGGSDGCCLIVQQRRPMIEKANERCVTL